MDLREIGASIRTARRAAGPGRKRLTIAEVSTMAHISPAALSRLERGTIPEIGIRKVMRVLDVLGLELRTRTASPFPILGEDEL